MTGLVADRRLHPATLYIGFVRKIPEFVIGLPAAVGWASDAGILRLLLLASVGAGLAFGASLLGWLRFRYGVGETEIVIESGVLQRQRRIIPFHRIQDIDIEQGPLARLSRTAKVRIETGGAARDEGRLEAIALSEAHGLRDLIRRRRQSVAETPAEEETEPLLFTMELPRLLLSGAFNFSLLFLAALGTAFQYLQPWLDLEAIDPEEWIIPGAAAAERVTLLGSALFLAVLLLLGLTTGIVRTVARDFGFRLSRTGAGLRRVRGLVTRSEVVIPLQRIQLAVIRSGIIARIFGWAALEYQTLSAGSQQSGHQAAVPFGSMSEISCVLSATGHQPLPSDDRFVGVSRLSVARRLGAYGLPLMPATLAAALVEPRTLFVLAAVPVLALAVLLQWKRHRFALTDELLVISQGLFRNRLWIMPFDKAQTFTVSRSFLQRRLGLATLTVDTAGASLIDYPSIVDLAESDADILSARLLALYAARRQGQRRAR